MYKILETRWPKGCYQKIGIDCHIDNRDKINALRQAGYRMNPDSYRQRMKNDGMVEFFREVYYKEIL